MKLLRKVNPNKIKYYLCGEYGTNTMRPHYHMLIFNAEENTIAEQWQYGTDTHFGQIQGASVGYTLKYIDKNKKIPLHINDDRVPEFSLMSKKLGDNYLTPSTYRRGESIYRCKGRSQ
jgi:hypothetical protein